ncbi:MAG TPA: oxygen-independent coproporphyrinogen III oxidase [Burkholderiales bacterium]|nr:oxygen-independent coproporphyrinogen III oxidase [Burkholderiales bacterium]
MNDSVDAGLLRRLERSGPRYTSYPTADRFLEAFGPDAYRVWTAKRNIGGITRPLSLYVHIPFCSSPCFYCACNKIVTRDRGKVVNYLRYLLREIALQGELFRDDPDVVQLHWGGGTPTFLNHEEVRQLMAAIRSHFRLAPEGEYSVEIDPRTADEETMAVLAQLGFNRASIGVQDFDPVVQRAVNRVQTKEETMRVIDGARGEGFKSVSIDLIYGLPHQNIEGFDGTLESVIAMNPDRVSIYSYAHLPNRFKAQRRINEAALPDTETKLRLLGLAIERMTEAGYVYIGMDHFARPDDELTQAQRQGRLHRNFQGYSTYADCDMVALGVSAIGKIGPTYCQNFRELKDYYDCLDRGQLPIMRGIELTADDLVRRAVIQILMCHVALSKDAIEKAHVVDFDNYFAPELQELEGLEWRGLLALEERWINVTQRGRFAIRDICMVFDKYLRTDLEHRRYSRLI